MSSRISALLAFAIFIAVISCSSFEQDNPISGPPSPTLPENVLQFDSASLVILDSIVAAVNKRLGEIKDTLAKIKADTTKKGKLKLRGNQALILSKLEFCLKEMNDALKELKEMKESPDFTFSLEAIDGKVGETTFPIPGNYKNVKMTFNRNDTANAIHEIKHGYQVLNSEVFFLKKQGDFIAHYKDTLKKIDLEVMSYQREYAYRGYLNGHQTPPPNDPFWIINKSDKFVGDIKQVNSVFKIRDNYKEITPALVRSMQRSQYGDTLIYKDYY